jgi:hypothetical protein
MLVIVKEPVPELASNTLDTVGQFVNRGLELIEAVSHVQELVYRLCRLKNGSRAHVKKGKDNNRRSRVRHGPSDRRPVCRFCRTLAAVGW